MFSICLLAFSLSNLILNQSSLFISSRSLNLIVEPFLSPLPEATFLPTNRVSNLDIAACSRILSSSSKSFWISAN